MGLLLMIILSLLYAPQKENGESILPVNRKISKSIEQLNRM